MDKIIFKESCHYYSHLGEPIDCVPYSKPRREGLCPICNNATWTDVKGDKSTCKLCKAKIYVGDFESVKGKEPGLSDARKYGLFPSISRMCSYGEMEFTLSAWSKSELIKWVMDNYKEDRKEWDRVIQAGIEAFENRFSDPGSYVHGQIAKAMQGEPFEQSPTIIRVVSKIRDWCDNFAITAPMMERGYCDPHLGLGGCIDMDSWKIIADFKCKFNPKTFEALKAGKNRNYLESVIKQLAGYRAISSKPDSRCFVIPVRIEEDHSDSGEICPIELTEDELSWGLKAIKANAEAWFINKKYDPREIYFKGLCQSKAQILNTDKEQDK